MRNLTITRRKSFIGCAMNDHVYIRDDLTPEITIDGTPCKKIGIIKNGETKTFQIDESEQQIFLIADKLSKNYCNATITIPEGQEDIVLSGIHKFVYGSNPFRFDGIEQTKEDLAKQKRNGRIGAIIIIAGTILGLITGQLIGKGIFGPKPALPQTFTKDGFQITLTNEFKIDEKPGFFSFYSTKSAAVFTVREDKNLFGDISLKEYGELVLYANGKTGLPMNQEDNFIWFEYTAAPEKQEIYYLAVCLQSEDAFWIVNFSTPASNRNQYKDTFLSWAKSITIDQSQN